MSIIGIGTDIIEISRIEKAASTSGGSFLERNFTADENKLFDLRSFPFSSIAANFAAKEAFVKAIGTGFAGIVPIEIEVLRNKRGKPYINVYGAAQEAAKNLGVTNIHVSLAHSKENAQAFVILED